MNKVDKNPSEVKLKPIKLIVKKPTEAKEDNNIKTNNSKEIIFGLSNGNIKVMSRGGSDITGANCFLA